VKQKWGEIKVSISQTEGLTSINQLVDSTAGQFLIHRDDTTAAETFFVLLREE